MGERNSVDYLIGEGGQVGLSSSVDFLGEGAREPAASTDNFGNKTTA